MDGPSHLPAATVTSDGHDVRCDVTPRTNTGFLPVLLPPVEFESLFYLPLKVRCLLYQETLVFKQVFF